MKRMLTILLCAAMALALLAGCTSAQADTGASDAAALVMDIPTTQYFTKDAVNAADVEKILQAGVNAPSAMNTQPWHFTAVTDAAVLEEIAGAMSFGGPPSTGKAEADAAEKPSGERPSPPEGASFPSDMKPPEGGSFPSGMTPPEGGNFPSGMKPPEGGNFPSGMKPPEGGSKPEGAAPPDAGSAPAALGSKAGLTDAPLAIIISCEKGSELSAGLACQNMSVEAQLLGYGSKIISSPTIALNGERREEFAELLGIPEGQSAVAVLLVGREDTSVDKTADTYTGATSRSPMSEKVSYVKAS